MRHFARKKWGQNFLADTNLLDKIVRAVDPADTDRILEIGPGEGALTERLLSRVKKMAAVEIDPRLVEYLSEREALKGCEIIHGDILMQELNSLAVEGPLRIMGNIPYNITSPILFWLIDQRRYWTDAFIMIQKEVADRLAAGPGTKAYGRLTVMVGAFLDVKVCFTIPPEVFLPKPKVDSALITLRKKSEALITDDKFAGFEKIVGAAFSKRRKMLRNSLAGFKLAETGRKKIDLARRPETLTIEEFVSLVD